MLDRNDEPTTMEEIHQKFAELKEGTVHTSNDGKVKFVREKGKVLLKDADGNVVMAQPTKSKKVTAKNYQDIHSDWEKNGKKGKEPQIGQSYKYQPKAPEGFVYKSPQVIAKYEQEKLNAGLEEGQPTGENDFNKIAETSENPTEIKAAWKEEKSRLEERKSESSETKQEFDNEQSSDPEAIYKFLEKGISAEDAKALDIHNELKEGSISAVGWRAFKTGRDSDIDFRLEKAGLNKDAVADFIRDNPKGPNEFKKKQEETLNKYSFIWIVKLYIS